MLGIPSHYRKEVQGRPNRDRALRIQGVRAALQIGRLYLIVLGHGFELRSRLKPDIKTDSSESYCERLVQVEVKNFVARSKQVYIEWMEATVLSIYLPEEKRTFICTFDLPLCLRLPCWLFTTNLTDSAAQNRSSSNTERSTRFIPLHLAEFRLSVDREKSPCGMVTS